ncbi:arylesterase [Robiginitalea aurantiaca]|uniref:Arylesterase n=1 Tax=Robiginitalea aurantiaca TaxID=3056915 RepID=A0ABT7WCV9_9FLAO|nr:arylesterase [Robiginitalea aurantiaca]MDM9630767.1 arylesterase [Robiginitalea aurantiaca]
MSHNRSPRLLKFSYIFCFICLFGCGDATSSKSTENSEITPVAESPETKPEKSGTILFFGDSLTAGLGLDPNLAFPGLLQQRLDSLGYSFEVINAGLSGETTASGSNRLGWVLRQPVDVFVLELGANDGLRGIPLSETRKNLKAMIAQVRKTYPEVVIVLAGMQLPPNMGPEYTDEFRKIFPEIAESEDILLIPFLLQDVGGIPELNQEDGIHPTEEGHKIVAENVWEVLQQAVGSPQKIDS